MTKPKPKITELYAKRRISLVFFYRGKARKINYLVTLVVADSKFCDVSLRSLKYPCEVLGMEDVTINMDDD